MLLWNFARKHHEGYSHYLDAVQENQSPDMDDLEMSDQNARHKLSLS